jgi:hypothetical protein
MLIKMTTPNPLDVGSALSPRSSSDYSGSREPRCCAGCGVGMGSYTPAQWARITLHQTCDGDPHDLVPDWR